MPRTPFDMIPIFRNPFSSSHTWDTKHRAGIHYIHELGNVPKTLKNKSPDLLHRLWFSHTVKILEIRCPTHVTVPPSLYNCFSQIFQALRWGEILVNLKKKQSIFVALNSHYPCKMRSAPKCDDTQDCIFSISLRNMQSSFQSSRKFIKMHLRCIRQICECKCTTHPRA